MPRGKIGKPDEAPGEFPTRPRFNLESLREIRIATGDGESTLAAYTYTVGGTQFVKYATFDELTHAEREAALEFVLRFGAVHVRRKAKPRGRAAAPRTRRPPATLDLSEVDLSVPDFGEYDLPDTNGEGFDDLLDLALTDRPDPDAGKVLPRKGKTAPRRKQSK